MATVNNNETLQDWSNGQVNPYSTPTKKTFWDKVVSGVGLRSSWDTLEAERKQKEIEWENNLKEAQRVQEYEEPENQMQRMQDAGINPLVSGGEGISSGQSAQKAQTEPINYAEFSAQQSEQVANIANACLSALNVAAGIGDKIYSMIGKGIINKKNVLNNAEGVFNFFKDNGLFLTEQDFVNYRKQGTLPLLPTNFAKSLRSTLGHRGFNHFNDFWTNYVGSMSFQSGLNDTFSNNVKSKQQGDYFSAINDFLYSPESNRQVLKEIGDSLVKMRLGAYRYDIEAQNLSSKMNLFRKRWEDENSEGLKENWSNELDYSNYNYQLQKIKRKSQGMIESEINRLLEKLSNASKDSDFAAFAYSLLSIFMQSSFSIPSLPKINLK